MNISVAIVDSDRDYAERLMGGLENYPDLSLSVFFSGEKFQTALEKNKYDIVVFNPGSSEETLHFGTTKLPVCLCSNESDKAGLYEGTALMIEKYQRISTIYRQIMAAYADKAGIDIVTGSGAKTKLVTVYSPIGGSGKTTVAYAAAMTLAGAGKRVLYMNLEAISSMTAILPAKERGIVDLIEAVEKDVNFSVMLKGTVEEGLGGVNYVGGFNRVADYRSVTESEIESLLTHIKNAQDFEYVILDTASDTGVITRVALNISDKILLVEKPGDLELAKMQIFTEQAIYLDNAWKMVRVCNFADGRTRYSDLGEMAEAGTIQDYGNYQVKGMLQNIMANASIRVSAL